MSQISKTRTQINRKLAALPTYCDSIPIEQVFAICKEHGLQAVQEDGSPWSGFLCGSNATASIELVTTDGNVNAKAHLYLGWYQMPSGRYEITSYIS